MGRCRLSWLCFISRSRILRTKKHSLAEIRRSCTNSTLFRMSWDYRSRCRNCRPQAFLSAVIPPKITVHYTPMQSVCQYLFSIGCGQRTHITRNPEPRRVTLENQTSSDYDNSPLQFQTHYTLGRKAPTPLEAFRVCVENSDFGGAE